LFRVSPAALLQCMLRVCLRCACAAHSTS
jgi:hypothetical protein